MQRGEAPTGDGRQGVFRSDQEKSVGATVRAAYAPAKLVEVGQSEAIGVIHDDGVGARDVQSVFDERRGHQHIVFRPHELEHRPSRVLFRRI